MTSKIPSNQNFAMKLWLWVHQLSERAGHLLKESLFNGVQRSWNYLASVKQLEMELDLNSKGPFFQDSEKL